LYKNKSIDVKNVIRTAKLMSNIAAYTFVGVSAFLIWSASEIFPSTYIHTMWIMLVAWVLSIIIYFLGRKAILQGQIRKYERALQRCYGYDHRVSIFWANDYFSYSGIVDVLREEKGDGVESLVEASHIRLQEEHSGEEKYIVLLPVVEKGITPGIHYVTQKGPFTVMVQPMV